MKTLSTFIFSLFFSFLSYSQYYEMLGSSKEDHLENFSEENGFFVRDSANNYIQFVYVGEKDTTMYLTCYFEQDEIKNETCYMALYSFLCNSCALENIARITTKKGEWVASELNYFVSKRRLAFNVSLANDRESDVKTMRLNQTPNDQVAYTILFEKETMRTKQWRELIKN